MFRRIFDRNKLEVSIISCGDTGQEIGAKMIKSLKEQGTKIKSLSVTSESVRQDRDKLFGHRILIQNSHDGFAKRLDDAIEGVKSRTRELEDILEKIIPDKEEGLLMITTGAGATGLSSALIIVDLVYRKYRKTPPIVTLLPEIFENSRVQYNISSFLYKVAFRPENYGNSVLLLDNKPLLKEMDQPFSRVSKRRVDEIPVAFADLLYASFDDALSSEFDGKVNDLFEVMHTPGISVFIAEDLSTEESEGVDSSNISDVILDSVMTATSLSRDQVFDAKNAFISIFNIEDNKDDVLSFQTEFEARKLYRSFRETHPFIKIVKPNIKTYGSRPKLRGIVSGLPLPNRILQVMRIARKSRKDIIIKEHDLSKEVIPMDIDRITRLEDNLQEIN